MFANRDGSGYGGGGGRDGSSDEGSRLILQQMRTSG